LVIDNCPLQGLEGELDKKLIFIVGGGLILVIIAVIAIVLMNKKPGQITGPASNAKIITVWDYNNEKAAYDNFFTKFQQATKYKVEYVSKDKTTYIQDTIDAIAAGTAPDVWIVPSDLLPNIKNKIVPMPTGKIANTSKKQSDLEVFSNVYPKVVYENNVLDNQIYGMPIAMDTLKLFMNYDLLSQTISQYRRENSKDQVAIEVQDILRDDPKNWDQFVKMVRFFEKVRGDKFARTVAMGTSENVNQATDLLVLLMQQNGVKMVSDDLSTAQFHTAQNIFSDINYPGTKALEFYASFANAKNENYAWDATQANSVRAFAEKKVAMMFDYDTVKSQISNISPNFTYKTLDVPQVKETLNPINIARYDTFVVPKSSKNQKLAWDLILFAYDTRNVNAYYNITKKKQVKITQDKTNPALTAKSWYNPDPIKVDEIFKTAIKQVNEGKDAQTAMDGAGGQVTALLGKLKQR